jgi:hypothetical protein
VSDDHHQDPDYVIGAVLAQIEDLGPVASLRALHDAIGQVVAQIEKQDVPVYPPEANLPMARAVSNGDTPPCWALACPTCGDIDTMIASFIDITAVRGKPKIGVFELRCRTCGTKCKPPTTLER